MIVAFSHHSAVRLAEVAFLLILIAGVWLAVAEVPQIKGGRAHRSVAGLLLALAGLLLVIAVHWGRYG